MVHRSLTSPQRNGRKTATTQLTSDEQLGALLALTKSQQQRIDELEKALAAREAEHNDVLDETQALTHLGSWQWQIGSNKIVWSDELYRLYGLKPQERSIGFDEFIGLIHPEDQERVKSIINTAFTTCEPFDFTHRVTLPDGEERTLHGMGKVVCKTDGSPERMYGTSQDITERTRLDRAKDEFISLASHQLRTPLTVIRMYSDMLINGMVGPLTPEQREHTLHISEAACRLIALVGEMLTLSRLELNGPRLQSEPTDINQLIQTYVDELTPTATAKKVKLEFAPSKLPPVPLDSTSFGQVIHNLLHNALTYVPPKRGRVEVGCDKEGDCYVLSVRDNGIGIPQSELEHIFQRFYRAENASALDANGTGLGLYLVKLIVAASGGTIKCESKLHKGTTFVVRLPARVAGCDKAPAAAR